MQPRAVHDKHVFRRRHPDPSGRDPATRTHRWQGEIALKMRASLKRPEGWGCALRRPQCGHRIVECLLTPLRTVERPPVNQHLIALAARLLSGPGPRHFDIFVPEE